MARLPTDNSEQDDGDQAQDIGEEALNRSGDPSEDSDKAPGDDTDIIPDDVPDLVDKMTEMVRSGHIDNDAFAGEPMHDDEEDRLGATDDDDDD